MKINLSFDYEQLTKLRSQIDFVLSDSRLCSPYVISFDVPECSVSAEFADPFSGSSFSPRERMSDDDKHLENFYCGGL